MSAIPALVWEVRRGASLDRVERVQINSPDDPRQTGAWFALLLKRSRDDVEQVHVFDSRDPGGALTIDDWLEGAALSTLSFRASRTQTLALPPGALVGDLMHVRPRPNFNFGPMAEAVATVTVTVI